MASRTTDRLRRSQSSSGLRAVAFPLFLLVGILLLIPGAWGAALLAGVDVPMAHREQASIMAGMMLLSWPVAIFLFVAAFMIRPGAKR